MLINKINSLLVEEDVQIYFLSVKKDKDIDKKTVQLFELNSFPGDFNSNQSDLSLDPIETLVTFVTRRYTPLNEVNQATLSLVSLDKHM